MNYAPPEDVPVCPCREAGGIAHMFCPTGHMVECHHPLPCDIAACGHLPRYYDDMTEAEMAGREETAIATLQQFAQAGCEQCKGGGSQEVKKELELYDGTRITTHATAICACVSAGIPELPDPHNC